MPNPLVLIPNAVGQSSQRIIWGQVSSNQAAPTSFGQPLYVVRPDWNPDYNWVVTDWPACHGSTLPAQGAECLLLIDTAQNLRCVWWDGIADWSVIKEAPLNVEWAPYGASPSNTDTQNATAINAALAALPASGGELFFPRRYATNGQINLANLTSIHFRGTGGMSGGAATGSGLTYTGTAASFINAKGISGLELVDLQVLYNNVGFTGTLLDCSAGISGANSIVVARAHLSGAGISTAAQLVSLDGIGGAVAFRDVGFGGAGYAILGRAVAGSFANAVTIEDCVFNGLGTAAILNPGQGWSIRGCAFEGLANGQAGGIVSTLTAIHGLDISGNWFGDVTSTTAAKWIDLPLHGSSICGNYIGGNTNVTAINFQAGSSGVVAKGNTFDTATNAFALPSGADHMDLSPNYYTNVANIIASGAGTLLQTAWDGGSGGGQYLNATAIHVTDGLGTRVATTTGLTSAQIDALFSVTALDGYVLVDSANDILLYRANGKWYKVAGTLIP